MQERVDTAGAVAAWASAKAAGVADAEPGDFLPKWGQAEKRQSAEDMIAVMRGLQSRKRKKGTSK